nr:sensor histidine kinase [uncultured Pedobacter sp.]
MLCRYLFLLLIISCNLLPGYAQQPLLRHYTISDGLTSNTVYGIFQDSRGFMWFCTDWGVCRFDGHHFEAITSDNGLLDNEVFGIKEDTLHRLWLNPYNKSPAYIYNDKVYTVRNDTLCRYMAREGLSYFDIPTHQKNANPEEGMNGVTTQNRIIGWPGMAKKAIFQFSDKGIDYIVYGNKIVRKADSATVVEFKEHYFRWELYQNGHLYLSAAKVSDQKVKIIYDIVFNDGKPLIKETKTPYNILAITIGKNGRLWCCTVNGIGEFDPTKDSISEDRFITMKGIVTYNSFVDRQGNCWYATNEGVYMQPTDTVLTYTTASGLVNDNVNSVCYMPGGDLLAGYDNGNIMLHEGNTFRPLGIIGEGYWSRIVFLLPTDRHTFFAGTDIGLFRGNTQKNECKQLTIHAEKSGALRGNLLLLGRNAHIYGTSLVYNLETDKLNILSTEISPVTATTIDAQGTYWLGTTQSLYYYNTTLRKFIRDSTFPPNRVTSLNILKGRLIISTHSDGLFIRDGSRMIRLNKDKGLINNICKKTYIDEKERLWVNTDKGLDRITFHKDLSYSIYHFSAADGVPGHMVNDITFGNGKAFIATSKGIIMIDQDQTSSSLPYKVYILKVALKDSVLNYPERIVLNYNQNNVQVSYTAISFIEGRDIRYKYLLQGAGNDTIVTEEGTLNLGALEPGDYQLMVWAAGRNNIWNKVPAILHITVKPPFWGSIWFIVTIGCLLLIIIVLIYRHRINIIRKKETEKAERKRMVAELEMQALRAQINPHFMFNALNAIQNYYSKNDELGANYYMASFSSLIRKTLTHSKEHWNTIANEMSMLKAYIELEQMRFKHRFSYEIFMDPTLEKFKIPTMLLQIYTENAINHGLRYLKQDNGKLIISCHRSDDAIVCTIEDNGVGFEEARRLDSRPGDYKSMGLKITAGRIAAINELYGTSIATHITDKQSQGNGSRGTIVTITIKNTPLS